MQAKLYLPQEADNYSETLETVKRFMSDHFGGYTVHNNCTGGWVDDNGDLIEEPVVMIEAYTSDSNDVYALMGKLAILVKRMTNEDAVMYAINHEAFFE